jgi:hypothetical protein
VSQAAGKPPTCDENPHDAIANVCRSESGRAGVRAQFLGDSGERNDAVRADSVNMNRGDILGIAEAPRFV